MNSKVLTFQQYVDFCQTADVGASYSPPVIDYYYGQLGMRPMIRGLWNRDGKLVAAYPTLYGQLFPNSLHKRMLWRTFKNVGDIGQPEGLFPVLHDTADLRLRCLSPVTSPLLRGTVRAFYRYPVKRLVIAKQTEHKRDTRKLRTFLSEGGSVLSREDIGSCEFADAYIRLHCARWNYAASDYGFVRQQIIALYGSVHGTLLLQGNEPVGVHFCLQHVGRELLHIESINIGVKPHKAEEPSYGSILLLASLRAAERMATTLGKTLRWNYGYYYGERNYKNRWGDPQDSFLAI